MNSRRPMPDMGGPSLRDSRSLSLPPARWQVLGAGLNRSEWRRRPHLWILVLAPSPQSSSRGLGPRRPSDTLQFVARCSSLALTPSLSLAVGCLVVAPVTSGQKRQRKRTVDARERHLWPVRKGGFPRGVSFLTRGVAASSPTGFPPSNPQPSLRAAVHRLILLHDLRVFPSRLKEPQSPCFRAKRGHATLLALKIGRSQEFLRGGWSHNRVIRASKPTLILRVDPPHFLHFRHTPPLPPMALAPRRSLPKAAPKLTQDT